MEAARELTGTSHGEYTSAPKHGCRLRRLLEERRIRNQLALCDVMHGAQAVLDATQERAPNWNACWSDPLFVAALEACSAAEIEYEQVGLATPEELLQMVVRDEVNERSAS